MTRIILNKLLGAHFDGPPEATVEALEIVPREIEGGVGGTAILTSNHFSGYVVAAN